MLFVFKPIMLAGNDDDATVRVLQASSAGSASIWNGKADFLWNFRPKIDEQIYLVMRNAEDL